MPPDNVLPPYSIRRSKRAKHLGLRIKSQRVEIVVPEHALMPDITSLLNAHAPWIEKHLTRAPTNKSDICTRPSTLVLRLLNEVWTVRYELTGGARTSVYVSAPKVLTVYGALDDAAIARVLLAWLKKKAQPILATQLKQCAQEMGMRYRSFSVRAQKTRWGSCTVEGKISLNVKLLFLEPALVHYVLVHELCHTVHLHHKPAFWQLVRRFVPNYADCVKALREQESHLPAWLEL